jgi:nitrite reductase (NO-forming)
MNINRSKLLAGAALSLLLAALAPAAGHAAESHTAHQHSAANGTAEAPLDVVREGSDLPGPIGNRGPATIKVNLETVEVTGRLATGAAYHYWTFNRKVPGPFVRVREGDTVEVTLANQGESVEHHSVDFHAVTGPGGGGEATDAAPGKSGAFRFKATKPGLYVYHCATPIAARHIANGMYGMILVEPKKGLTAVDREFYVMQGEVYTEEPLGSQGFLNESTDKLLSERPEYIVFNGSVEALKAKPLRARVGETIRIFFGVGGPNLTSSFHVIGGVFDKVYPMGSTGGGTIPDVQTVSVPPGGSTIVEMKLAVPGTYTLVDHALSRAARGLSGQLIVEGAENPATFKGN